MKFFQFFSFTRKKAPIKCEVKDMMSRREMEVRLKEKERSTILWQSLSAFQSSSMATGSLMWSSVGPLLSPPLSLPEIQAAQPRASGVTTTTTNLSPSFFPCRSISLPIVICFVLFFWFLVLVPKPDVKQNSNTSITNQLSIWLKIWNLSSLNP